MAETTSREPLSVSSNVVLLAIQVFMGACLLLGSVLVLTQPLPYAENPLLMKALMGWALLPVSVGIIAVNIRKIVRRRNAILIDERGVTDHTDGFASGFTPWEEIEEVFLLKLRDDTFLCAVPADYEAWLSGLGRRQRRLAEANADAGFAPIRIQFKKVTERYRAEDGLAACRRFRPDKVGRVRKIKR